MEIGENLLFFEEVAMKTTQNVMPDVNVLAQQVEKLEEIERLEVRSGPHRL